MPGNDTPSTVAPPQPVISSHRPIFPGSGAPRLLTSSPHACSDLHSFQTRSMLDERTFPERMSPARNPLCFASHNIFSTNCTLARAFPIHKAENRPASSNPLFRTHSLLESSRKTTGDIAINLSIFRCLMYLGDQELEEAPTSEDAFLQHLFDQNFSNF